MYINYGNLDKSVIGIKMQTSYISYKIGGQFDILDGYFYKSLNPWIDRTIFVIGINLTNVMEKNGLVLYKLIPSLTWRLTFCLSKS